MQTAHANKAVLFGITVLLFLLSGCAGKTRHLMPAPNLYTQAGAPELFTDLPDELTSNQIDLLYITDRVPEINKAGELSYGFRRSRSAAFGSAIVTWRYVNFISRNTLHRRIGQLQIGLEWTEPRLWW